MVKLLVDAHTFDETHQGIRSFLKGIYSAIDFTEEEVEVILAANDIENLKKEFKDQKSFKYVKLKSKNKYIRLAYEIPKLIRHHKIDFAHFNYFLPLFLSKRCKYIVTIHDVLFIDFPEFFPLKYRIINGFMYRRSAHKSSILTTVSRYSAERIRECFKTDDKTIHVIPNSVGEYYFEDRDKEADRDYMKAKYGLGNYMLYVSRIEPRKNHAMILKIFMEQKLWEQDMKMVFIGNESLESKELTELMAQIKDHSADSVAIFENVSNEELVKFYNAARLSVFLSYCEGFGIPPLESGVLKTPTLCSRATAMMDFDFFEEYLVDPDDKDLIKNKTLEILDNPDSVELKRRMVEIADAIKERYNWKKSAKKFKNSLLDKV
ncbi:MAG: glycosyltransferase family 4 protein [Flavobacteriaceae bacterium]|nr:glycosyltransferase family 4 protein [Bacteroidia bacterium]NNF82074.1 glycosyltransferase family 4 protein [Flavobacteriaceae bacterium]NNK68971.1 glycosyltransferase family 4 protein [Flavobacteriaceae bacterium]